MYIVAVFEKFENWQLIGKGTIWLLLVFEIQAILMKSQNYHFTHFKRIFATCGTISDLLTFKRQ